MSIKKKTNKAKKRLVITVPISLHTKLKVAAAQAHKTMEDIACKALEKEVEKQKNCL